MEATYIADFFRQNRQAATLRVVRISSAIEQGLWNISGAGGAFIMNKALIINLLRRKDNPGYKTISQRSPRNR